MVAVEGPLSTWQGALRAEEQAELDGAGAKRRAEYTAGRRCAREALSRLGVDGFPLLSDADRLPAWPPGVVGSISHGADYCVAAVAHAAEVAVLGVDVERGGPLGGRVAARVLADAERQRLAGLPPLPGGDWAKLAWSAKEAAFKAAFPVLRRRLPPPRLGHQRLDDPFLP